MHKIDSLPLMGKRICIIGLQGSGKSELAKYLIRQHKSSFIIDPMDEYGFVDKDKRNIRFIPPSDDFDFSLIFDKISTRDIDLFVVDEISRFCPSRQRGSKPIRDFADACRHSNTTFIAIARRPGQVFTDFTELAHYLFIFRLRGRNDGIWLANQASDLPSAVHGLKQYHFIALSPDRTFEEFEPISMEDENDRRQAWKTKTRGKRPRSKIQQAQ